MHASFLEFTHSQNVGQENDVIVHITDQTTIMLYKNPRKRNPVVNGLRHRNMVSSNLCYGERKV